MYLHGAGVMRRSRCTGSDASSTTESVGIHMHCLCLYVCTYIHICVVPAWCGRDAKIQMHGRRRIKHHRRHPQWQRQHLRHHLKYRLYPM